MFTFHFMEVIISNKTHSSISCFKSFIGRSISFENGLRKIKALQTTLNQQNVTFIINFH